MIVLKWADPGSGALNYKEIETALNFKPEELALTLGCSIDTLPVLVGGGKTTTPEGVELEFDYDLTVMDNQSARPTLIGTLYWTAGGVQSLRSVWMERTD